ncbi:MAG: ester cyclase [Methanoregula sp.]|uniref:ester cyclase n=1 Tax=Methanoregula sp. TaxID=2052170 RepID=UPI003D0E1BD5
MMSTVEENMRLMQTLDDAWNAQDWVTFDKRHAAEVDVFWPGQPQPTHSRHSHREEAIAFFKIFPDNRVGNRPWWYSDLPAFWSSASSQLRLIYENHLHSPGTGKL